MIITRTSIKNNYKYGIFFIIILAAGFVSGFLIHNYISDNLIIQVENSIRNSAIINSYDNILIHISLVTIIIISSFFIVGIIAGLFLVYYEGLSIGLSLYLFYQIYKIKGIIYILISTIFFKLIYIIILVFIIVQMTKNIKIIINNIINKKRDRLIFSKINKMLAILLINEIFIAIFSPKIINIFSFLITK